MSETSQLFPERSENPKSSCNLMQPCNLLNRLQSHCHKGFQQPCNLFCKKTIDYGGLITRTDPVIIDAIYERIMLHDYKDWPYFDFGRSTENPDGSGLNEPLVFQKEGFGARGLCYDIYEWDL